jgi:hypothetical protein
MDSDAKILNSQLPHTSLHDKQCNRLVLEVQVENRSSQLDKLPLCPCDRSGEAGKFREDPLNNTHPLGALKSAGYLS